MICTFLGAGWKFVHNLCFSYLTMCGFVDNLSTLIQIDDDSDQRIIDDQLTTVIDIDNRSKQIGLNRCMVDLLLALIDPFGNNG